ncbi:MAG TPA: N-acyl homoserine lactonase family protein [Candidatus Acidoferrum sp.]|nr:N-acyl homoserine lactonase family protein [Candidatus Acidoferrum sp.]
MKRYFSVATLAFFAGASLFFPKPAVPQGSAPDYSIQAIRYASAEDQVAGLVMGAPKGEKIEIAMVVWLIRGGGRNILFDSGYHRETFLKYFPSRDYIRPDEAVKLAGVLPEQITDIVISHSHWDHLGGIDLFPHANVWIQKEEYRYYTGDAWQPRGDHGGIDPEDVQQLVKLNTEGRIHLVDGDNVEIFPGIHAYTGGHHTYASQYIRVAGDPPFVLASDNCYLYRNLVEHKASATFTPDFHATNIENQKRMIELAGSNPDRVIPGHDALQFEKYPTTAEGRIAKIK